MNKINFLPIILLSLLVGCGETEVSQKYVFDSNDMEKNIKKYTVSKEPMAEFGCAMTSIIFSKEILNALKSNKEPDMSKLAEVDTTPTIIELFKDKIVWNDLGQETKIKDNIVYLKGFGGETLKLKLIKNEDNINFKFEEDKLICLFPFKKST